MYNLIKDSFFLSYIYNFLIFLCNKFKESFIYNCFLNINIKFNTFLNHSTIWNYFFKVDSIDRVWKKSGLVNLVNIILNFPAKTFKKLYIKHEDIFEASLLFKFLNLLSNNFSLVIGLGLILTIIVPDHSWYNIYSVLLVFLMLLLFIFKSATRNDFYFDLGNLDFPYIIFMVSIGLSAILSLFPKESLNSLIFYLITFLTVLMIASSIKTTKELNNIIELLVFGVFLTALYGLYQWKIVGIEVNPSLTDITVNQGMSGRVFSTMGNPNIYGELLVMTMPFFIVGFLNTRSIFKKLLYSLAFLVTTVILLKTGSRSAWVSFAAAIMVFIFLKDKKLLLPMIVLGFLALPFLPDSIYRRMMTIFNPNDSSLQYRKDILEPAMPMLKDYWITGVGLGIEVFNTIYKRYKSFTLKTVAHTHNLFLQVWLESGVIAIVSLLWLGIRLVKKTVFIVRNSNDSNLKNIVIAAISGIAGLMVMGFADHVWFYNRILFIFWILASFIFVGINLTYKEINTKENN